MKHDLAHIMLVGPQASGKSTIQDALAQQGYEKIISYTTRPPRNNELDGIDYWFLNDDEFTAAFVDSELTCIRSYPTAMGIWRYGFAWKDLNRAVDSVVVVDPSGYLELRNQMQDVFGIFIDIPDDIRRKHLTVRGDNPIEVKRRWDADNKDFELIRKEYTEVFDMRIGQERSTKENIDRILMYINKWKNGDME